MERRYIAFAERLRERMRDVGIPTNRELRSRLARARCPVGENMVSRWMTGQSRPWGANLEAVLDVIGVMHEVERNEWRARAYAVPDAANRDPADALADLPHR